MPCNIPNDAGDASCIRRALACAADFDLSILWRNINFSLSYHINIISVLTVAKINSRTVLQVDKINNRTVIQVDKINKSS